MRQARLIGDSDGNAIITRFFHRVTIHDGAKDIQGLVDRSPGKSAVRRVRETVPQMFGNAPIENDSFFRVTFCFELQADLRAVRLVGNANDIGSVGEKPGRFAEFLDRGNIHAAAGFLVKCIIKVFSAFDAAHVIFMQELPGSTEKLRRLRVQIFPIRQNDNGWVTERLPEMLGQKTGEKKHRIGFPAARGAKIGPAFTVAFGTDMGHDILEHFLGREKLGVAADDRFLIFAIVGIENEIPQNFQNTFPGERALNHGFEGIDPLGGGLMVIDFIPGIKVGGTR